jgi:hypothetical protein
VSYGARCACDFARRCGHLVAHFLLCVHDRTPCLGANAAEKSPLLRRRFAVRHGGWRVPSCLRQKVVLCCRETVASPTSTQCCGQICARNATHLRALRLTADRCPLGRHSPLSVGNSSAQRHESVMVISGTQWCTGSVLLGHDVSSGGREPHTCHCLALSPNREW